MMQPLNQHSRAQTVGAGASRLPGGRQALTGPGCDPVEAGGWS
jgi:hypothetical protein